MSITHDFESRLLPLHNSTVYGKDETEALLEHTRACEEMLKKHATVKVSRDDDNVCWDYCPECREYFPDGDGVHKPDCQLDKLLDGVP